jgi:uncharacterized protein (DUF58 family)
VTDPTTKWRSTGALGRCLAVGGLGLVVALVLGHPVLVVLVAPLIVTAALQILHRPRQEPQVFNRLAHSSLHEGQGTRTWLDLRGADDVEVVTRVVAQAPYLALEPAEGAVAYPAVAPQDVQISPRRWGRRVLAAERVGLTSPWGGFRWGPVMIPGRQMVVLPTLEHVRSVGEAPQPIGLIGAHRSRRDGNGTEFSSIRAFHSGDRLRRINWRISMRTGTLHVESTRAEEDTAVLLIVDALAEYGLSEGVGGAESSLDVTVRAAAAIAEQYLGGGDRVAVRVLSPGGEFAPYRTGTAHLRRILTLLATIRPGIPRDVEIDQIDFRATAGTVVVVISPMLSEALATATVRLVRRGLSVIVVDPLPAGSTPTAYPESDAMVAALAWRMRLLDRSHLLAQLAAAGCPVVPWNGPRTLEEVLRRLARRAALPRAGS